MIRKVRGNLLEAEVEALVNTVNTVGVMGKGIALQFRKAFPENYDGYLKVCKAGELKPGAMFIHELRNLSGPRFIINFPTKTDWKSKSKLEYIDRGLEALAMDVRRLGIRSIAIPPLGCGLGGLDWNTVYSRISAALSQFDDVEILVYEPAGAPSPDKMLNRTAPPEMTAGRAALLGLMRRYLAALMDDAITLLEIHKLMYFMQEAGQRLRLQYVKGTYGPYARNLHQVLNKIEGHFIVGFGDGSESPGKVIEYDPVALEAAERFLADQPETQQRFSRIEELIQGFETPYGMELLSSVHWVACHEDGHARTSPDAAVAAVHGWNDRKRQLFKPDHIRVAWNSLRELKWL